MKKLRTLLTLLVVSMCAVQSAWARTAPTFPTVKTLESGKTYYLYNVGSDRFATRTGQNGYVTVRTDAGKTVKLSLVNGTQYTIQFTDDDDYWYSYGEYVNDTKSNGDTRRFNIVAVDGGYTIQRVYNSVESEYLGYDGNINNYVKANVTGENIVWQLLDPIEAARYKAKRNLYRALEANVDFDISEYEAVYENEASTNDELQAAANQLNNAYSITNNYKKQSWSDYPILFSSPNSDWICNQDNTYFHSPYIQAGTKTTLTATVVTDDDATLVYSTGTLYNKVYLDDELVAYHNNSNAINGGTRHFVEMGPGRHVIKWVFENDGTSNAQGYVYNAGIERTPTINVSLVEAGSLGTEVLKNTEHIQNVRKLVVSGPMNSDDWERVMMMTSLFTLDLTDAEITEIPSEQLSKNYHSSNLSFFHAVKLPKTLKSIGNEAFEGSYIDDITFPNGLTTIGEEAFRSTKIKRALLPETVTSVGGYAFADNQYLTKASFPASAVTIPSYCYNNCSNLEPFDIPEGITNIESRAFFGCKKFKSTIPTSVNKIASYAFFESGMENVVIHENVALGSYAFGQCANLKTIELPTSTYTEIYELLVRCYNLTDVYFKSPTMVASQYKNIFNGLTASNITIHVPSYLVNSYKQDSYWYQYNIEGFSTADITDWYISSALALKAGERLEGTPNVTINTGGSLSISGNDAMSIADFVTKSNTNWSMVISNCNNIKITGQYRHAYYTKAKTWYFIALPFDVKVSNITCRSGSKAIRYYNGANRAENGTGGNWKNYSQNDIIKAGTGFIYQTSVDCWSDFIAENNESKQYVFSNNEFVKALDANDSESTANKGWNLVGNPWLSYYNIHKLNFTAPITVWNVDRRNYTAYSIIDDDYAILPNQAFFVQCPDEVSTISFPIDGRQLTSVIESQNGAPALEPTASERKLVDMELTDGELGDKTRFVLNPQASMEYETQCDASKFFSLDASVPQIYTIERGVQLAINERPADSGVVRIGIKIPADGIYTIRSERNALTDAVLVDNQNGTEVSLTTEGYTFSAEAGTTDSRFELHLAAKGETTNIREIGQFDNLQSDNWYDLQGRQIVKSPNGQMAPGVYVVNGKKVVVK